MGVYPKVSLKDAREKLRLAKINLDKDQDPNMVRQEEKRAMLTTNFEQVAQQWWEHNKDAWSHDHAARVFKSLKDNGFNDLGHLSIDEITPKQVIPPFAKSKHVEPWMSLTA